MVCRTVISQEIWEASFNVMPLFTEEDKIFVEEKKQAGREDSGIKTVARRFEGEIVEVRRPREASIMLIFVIFILEVCR